MRSKAGLLSKFVLLHVAHRRRALVSDEITLVEINEVELAEGRNQTETLRAEK